MMTRIATLKLAYLPRYKPNSRIDRPSTTKESKATTNPIHFLENSCSSTGGGHAWDSIVDKELGGFEGDLLLLGVVLWTEGVHEEVQLNTSSPFFP